MDQDQALTVKPFVITGCGRSGTTFTWRLLNRLGIRASHEEYFRPSVYAHVSPYSFIRWLYATDTKGEVSGLAPPLLAHIAEYCPVISSEFTIYHQVRNPVAVIASLMGLRNFHPEHQQSLLVKYNFRFVPSMDTRDDPIISCMKYWLHWNRLVPSMAIRFQAESLIEWAGAWELVSGMVGSESPGITEEECQYAVDDLGDRVHSLARDPSVSWRRLPDAGGLKEAIFHQAREYGYSPKDLDSYCPLGEDCPHCGPHPLGG